jgi:hypothetical protein
VMASRWRHRAEERGIRLAHGGFAAAAVTAACSSAQAPWRAAGRQQGRGEAVDERRDDAWTGESRGMDDGGQGRGTAPAAGAPVVQRRRTEEQGARRKKGDELNCGLICKFRERQGPYCKGLATFKPVLK